MKVDNDSILIPRIIPDKNLPGDEVHAESENKRNDNKGSGFKVHINILKKRMKHVFSRVNSANAKVRRPFGKKKKIFVAVGGTLLIFLLIVFALTFDTYRKVMVLRSSFVGLDASVKEQDLEKVKSELTNTRTNLALFKKSIMRLSFMRFTPFVGFYINDAKHAVNASEYGLDAAEILLEAVEPYADIIGFKTNSDNSARNDATAQERLDFVVKTIPDLISKADSLIEKFSLIKKEVDMLDPDKYPEKLGKTEVKSKVKSIVEGVDLAASFIENSKPLLEVSPYLLGNESPRKYLVLFQNDKELRPTGGFITAYSIGKVDKGRFEPVSSSDIYNLDSLYKPAVEAPEPLVKYLKGPYTLSPKYRLRDMNWSPDFSKSMDLFMKEAKKAGLEPVDGVIAVDTQLLVNILKVTGPIQVAGFGNFSTDNIPECNCPQVIFELESFADIEGPIVWSENEPGKIVFAPPNYDNRKKIIGPLMNSILANSLGQPKEKIPDLFNALISSLFEKHVLLYIFDEKAQNAASEFGIAGTLKEYDGDYLHIVDANLGGRKSNLYVKQEVAQEIVVETDGSVVKTLTLTYKNPEKQDGWLNSVLPNYLRIYVPEGSELLEFEGVSEKEKPYSELGKTVFAGFFEIRPQGVAQVTVKYKLPMKFDKEYDLFLQKQSGTDLPQYTVKIGKKESEFFLKTDKEVKFKI